MIDEHAKAIGIPPGHRLVREDLEWLGPNIDEETEVHYYEELNALGQRVGRYEVSVVTSMRAPYGNRTHISIVGRPNGIARLDAPAPPYGSGQGAEHSGEDRLVRNIHPHIIGEIKQARRAHLTYRTRFTAELCQHLSALPHSSCRSASPVPEIVAGAGVQEHQNVVLSLLSLGFIYLKAYEAHRIREG